MIFFLLISAAIPTSLQKVEDNDEAHIKLMKRVIDLLFILRKHFEVSPENLPPNLAEEMQEFEGQVVSS